MFKCGKTTVVIAVSVGIEVKSLEIDIRRMQPFLK